LVNQPGIVESGRILRTAQGKRILSDFTTEPAMARILAI